MATDGISEARHVTRGANAGDQPRHYEFFGTDGIRRLAESGLRSGASLDSFAQGVYDAAREFAGGSLTDDACLLIARWRAE